MKTYICIPGPPVLILVHAPDAPLRKLDGGPWGWGKDYIGVGATTLARDLMVDVLGPMNTLRAARLATRLAYRALKVGRAAEPLVIEAEAIEQHVAAIERTELDTAAAKAQAGRDVPIPVAEGGMGVGGGAIRVSDQDWTKRK